MGRIDLIKLLEIQLALFYKNGIIIPLKGVAGGFPAIVSSFRIISGTILNSETCFFKKQVSFFVKRGQKGGDYFVKRTK